MTSDELLVELFKRGQRIRDSWWTAYKANLERIGVELRANEAFIGDYGHLVASLPEAPQMPFETDTHPSPPPGQSYGPPPIPGQRSHEDEAIRIWEKTFGRLPGDFGGTRGEGQ